MAIADNAYRVDIGGLAEEAALRRCAMKGRAFCGVIFVDGVNEAGQCAAYSGFIFVEGDFLLGEHKFFDTKFFDVIRDLVWEVGGGGSLFWVEGEAAEVVESRPVDKIEKFVEASVGFAGEADDEGGAENAAGDFGSEGFNQLADFVFGMRAAHCFEDFGIDVLERDVEIWEYFIAGADGFDEAFGNSGGVEVKKSNPAESRDFGEVGEQFWKGVFNPKVAAISGDVLCNDIKFDCA